MTAHASLDDKPLAGLTILLLEDEFFIALATEEILKKAGAARIEIASHLSKANDLLDADFDAAVLDVRLPDGFSYPLADKLLAHNIPVTFHSGHVDADEVFAFPRAVFCSKPATPEQLVKGVLEARAKLAATV